MITDIEGNPVPYDPRYDHTIIGLYVIRLGLSVTERIKQQPYF